MSSYTDVLASFRSRMNRQVASPRGRGARRDRGMGAVMVVLAAWALGGLLGGARPAEAADGKTVLVGENEKFTATIRTDQVARERLKIPLGTSRVLDVSSPITRAEVAAPEVAVLQVLSPREILLVGVGLGTTQAILWDDQQNRLAFAVVVEPNMTELRDLLRETAPQASVSVKVVNDVIVLTGRAPNADTAQRIEEVTRLVAPKVQNQMTVAGEHQVVLRCTVAEVSKSAIRRLGVDAWASFEDNSPVITAHDLSGIDTSLIGPTAGAPGVGGEAFFGNSFLFGADAGGWQIGTSSQSLQMEFFVRAMQENGLLKILAEPNLVALSGQKATFLAGGEFPVPVPQSTISGITITIEWKDFGVMLEFVPTVIGDQMIRLDVAPEVSEIDFTNAVQSQGFVIPGVTQRRAATTIELASGTSIAIAGLLSEEIRGSVGKVPGLGDVPILGPMFRSVEYQRDLSELVILVTPEIVSPMFPDQVAPIPGAEMTIPDDMEFYMEGKLEGEPLEADLNRSNVFHQEIDPQYRKYASPPERMSLHGPWGPAEAEESEVETSE